MTKRYDDNEAKKDIYEANLEYLKRSWLTADFLIGMLWNVFGIVKCKVLMLFTMN